METGSTVFFACAPQYLDPFSLTYCWFGAVWKLEFNLKKVEAFWFSTEKEEVINRVKAKWGNWKEAADPDELKRVYISIREQQKQMDWNKKSLLSFKSVLLWRENKSGWYILRSNHNFPSYISLVKKNRFLAWLVHTDICENGADVSRFIEKVNREHKIKLSKQI